METQNKIALVTGANRGIGRALTLALLNGGASRVYATARDPHQLAALVAEGSGKIVPLQLDVTRPDEVATVANRVADLDVVFNNAGALHSLSFLTSSLAQVEQDLATNFLGSLAVSRALLPALERSKGGGALVNILSLISLAAMPAVGGYAASKAAAWSMTQALRPELKARGVTVFAVFPGPIDTDMSRDITLPKTSPEHVASAVLAAIARDQLDIFPDPMSEQVSVTWATSPQTVVQQFANM